MAFTVISAPAERPATPTRETFRMNPERLRAGKALEKTGVSPLLLGSSENAESAAVSEKPQTAPAHQSPVPAKVPKILFEDDDRSMPEAAFTRKFELGAAQLAPTPKKEEPKLPEAYGTGKLLLAPRDPHTLFAHWDLTNEQQRRYNSLSADGRLALRAYAHAFSNAPAAEVRLEPESRHVFVQVKQPGTSYVGELGYYEPGQHWKTIATSGPIAVPIDAPSEDRSATFATLAPPRPPIQDRGTPGPATAVGATADQLPSIIPVPVPRWPFGPDEDEQLAATESALQQAQSLSADAPLFVKRSRRKEWTPVQERLLAEMLRISVERREWINSAEIVQLVQSKVAPTEIPWPILPSALNISSPAGGEQIERKGFWFNLNAELVIYGATEPNTRVTVGGRPIELRPDGTFSCHFALPEGGYDLTAIAISPENEMRQATMNFHRHTEYSGEVGVHPQNPLLEQIPQP